MFDFIPLQYYTTISYLFISTLAFATGVSYCQSNNNDKLLKQNGYIIPLFIAIILILYIGLRPISGRYFGDMGYYEYGYLNRVYQDNDFKWNVEWFYNYLVVTCRRFHLSPTYYFLIVEIGYIGLQFWTCKRLLRENVWLAFFFCITALSFFTYGVNGIRNGFACSMMMLAIAFATDKKYMLWIITSILAIAIHKSTMLPAFATVLSLFLYKKTKLVLYGWFIAIPVSLLVGNFFIDYVGGLGVDDRMDGYSALASNASKMALFSHTGFRWDFLLYSSMPVALIYYVNVYAKIRDRTFDIISVIYLISNAFWILIIRIPYTNRFAYLSWFIYPIVLGYGLIRLPIWKSQDRILGYCLIAHAGFSCFMFFTGR